MPATFTYPGLYVEEVPSAVRPIAGVSSADTAFVDYFARGPVNEPTRVSSFAEFERGFGGLDTQSEASYALLQYYLNGGRNAWIVRADVGEPGTAQLALQSGTEDTVLITARNPGAWGNRLQVAATETVPDDPDRFNLFVREVRSETDPSVVATEAHLGVSMNSSDARHVVAVVEQASTLVSAAEPDGGPGERPDLAEPTDSGDAPDSAFTALAGGSDAVVVDPATGALVTGFDQALQDGWETLDRIDPFIFNLLCVPALSLISAAATQQAALDAAAAYCEAKRAFLLVDPPSSATTPAGVRTWLSSVGNLPSPNAALYFPRLVVADPLSGNRPRNVGAGGTMAGVYARTDAARGVWKAPAGTDASLRGGSLAVTLNDADNGSLNPFGINSLRNFPVFGPVAWGARTLFGADQRASEWKYVPVRRTALYIEQSLVEGLKWVVFEGNDETLWSQIRLNVTAFMQGLFLQGAFQGTTPGEAYLVKCDKTTTTQADVDRGVVNLLVGFAPLKPAEFVVIRIQQLAGQAQAS